MENRLFSLIGKYLFAIAVISIMTTFVPNARLVEDANAIDVNRGSEHIKLDAPNSCSATKGGVNKLDCRKGEVSSEAAGWLFLIILIGFVSFSNRRKL